MTVVEVKHGADLELKKRCTIPCHTGWCTRCLLWIFFKHGLIVLCCDILFCGDSSRYGNLPGCSWAYEIIDQKRSFIGVQTISIYTDLWGVWCLKQVSRTKISNYILQCSEWCNYLSMPQIPASSTKAAYICTDWVCVSLTCPSLSCVPLIHESLSK